MVVLEMLAKMKSLAPHLISIPTIVGLSSLQCTIATILLWLICLKKHADLSKTTIRHLIFYFLHTFLTFHLMAFFVSLVMAFKFGFFCSGPDFVKFILYLMPQSLFFLVCVLIK